MCPGPSAVIATCEFTSPTVSPSTDHANVDLEEMSSPSCAQCELIRVQSSRVHKRNIKNEDINKLEHIFRNVMNYLS